MDKAKKKVDMAAHLGTDVLMLVPMAHENIEKETPEQIRNQMMAHWRPIVLYAQSKGIHPIVEDTVCTLKGCKGSG